MLWYQQSVAYSAQHQLQMFWCQQYVAQNNSYRCLGIDASASMISSSKHKTAPADALVSMSSMTCSSKQQLHMLWCLRSVDKNTTSSFRWNPWCKRSVAQSTKQQLHMLLSQHQLQMPWCQLSVAQSTKQQLQMLWCLSHQSIYRCSGVKDTRASVVPHSPSSQLPFFKLYNYSKYLTVMQAYH